MNVGWLYDQRFLQHDTGPSHVECPERLMAIVEALEEAGLLSQLVPLPFRMATAEQLATVHEPAYVDLVRMMCDEGFSFIGTRDTCVSRWSYDIAALAAGAVIAACDAIIDDRVRRAFCAVRPPGHHAERDQAMGFCLFNNVAIGATHLLRHHHLKRIAIVDFDVHHGNGTQHLFEAHRDVFYISLHETPGSLPFPGSGQADQQGTGDGVGYTLNIPLARGSGDEQYASAMECQVLPAIDAFQPQAILVSAGFDALAWDDISHVSLEPASYGWITAMLVAAAERHCQGRLVSVLEGGYRLADLGKAVVAHVRELMRGS